MPKINNINKRFASLIDINKQNSSSNVKTIEAISEQISSMKDFLIEGRRLDAKLSRRQNRKSSETEKLITVFKDEIDEIRSKRNKIDSEIQSLLNEEKTLQKVEKKKQDEESTFYSRTGDSELRSGNIVSGLIFSFLGRNEKKQEVLDKEKKKADSDERRKRLDYLENEKTANDKERRERRDELKTPKTKPTASTSKPVNTPKSAIDPSIIDEKYAQKDKEIVSPTPIVIQSIIDPVTVEISKISNSSLADLKTLLESVEFKTSGVGDSSLLDSLSSLKQTFNVFSKLRPALLALSEGAFLTTLTAVTGGLAGAVASGALLFKGLNQSQEKYDKRLEDKANSDRLKAQAETLRTDTIAKTGADLVVEQVQARGEKITPELLSYYADYYTKQGDKERGLLLYKKAQELKDKNAVASPDAVAYPPSRVTTPPEVPASDVYSPVKVAPLVMTGNQKNVALLTEEMNKRGFNDKQIAAGLGVAGKESNLVPQTENMNYAKIDNARIRKLFGQRVAEKTDEELNTIKKDPAKMGETMYGKDTDIGKGMGNTEVGDGWKYRGRGFIQLTGKSNYAAASKAIFGVDTLVQNPDLANDPGIAAQISAWYLDERGKNMAGKMGVDLTTASQEDINRVMVSAVAGSVVKVGKGVTGKEGLTKTNAYAKQFGGGDSGGAGASDYYGEPAGGNYNVKQLSDSGLKLRGFGDVQAAGAYLDNNLVNLSKQLPSMINMEKLASTPGDVPLEFRSISGLNDTFHNRLKYKSKHTEGRAVDFALNRKPTKEEGEQLVVLLKTKGFSKVIDEYNNPSGTSTGGHIHAEIGDTSYNQSSILPPSMVSSKEIVASNAVSEVVATVSSPIPTQLAPTSIETANNNTGTTLYTTSAANKDLNTTTNTGASIVNAPQTTVVNNQTASNNNVREAPKDTSNTFNSIYNKLAYV